MEVKSIKGISNESWIKFKTLAAKNNVPMGKLFDNMLIAYSKKDDSIWDDILNGEKTISDKEAKEMHKLTKKLRNEKWERNVSNL